MECDDEMLDAFKEEVVEIHIELKVIADKLSTDKFNPAHYLDFSQVVDRIFGTATTLGFAEVGVYTGALRTACRQTGNSGIQQAMVVSKRLIDHYFDHYDLLLKSIDNDPVRRKNFSKEVENEVKIMGNMDKQIFSFIKDKQTLLKKS